jgi:hypothetical protein
MTNQGNGDQAQQEAEPVPTIPHSAQPQEDPIMQTNLIDESPTHLAQEDAVDLEENQEWNKEMEDDVIYLLFSIFSVTEFLFFGHWEMRIYSAKFRQIY